MGRPDSSNKDLRNTDKPNADFKKHKLYKTRFEFSNMPNSNFRAVSAKFACFIRANLAGSDFTGANLTNANFGGADEYQQAKLELVRKKIWVQTVKDERSESGFITVELKDGYEFLDNSDSRIKMFSDIENMLSETTKSKIKFPQQL